MHMSHFLIISLLFILLSVYSILNLIRVSFLSMDGIFTQNWRLHSNCRKTLHMHMKQKRPQITKEILHNTKTNGGITMLGFKLSYRAMLINSMIIYKNRCIDQWSRIEDQDGSSYNYRQPDLLHRCSSYTLEKRQYLNK